MGQCWHRSRYGQLRGERDPPLVAPHGPAGLSSGAFARDYRRRRRQQWVAPPTLEMGIAALCESHGSPNHRVSLSDRNLQRDEGWVSLGIDHDTASFAVNAIRRWWHRMGRPVYPRARSLVITADAGGSNGSRLRLWKWELQRFANRTGLPITVCHFPPGTSKW